MLYAFRESYQSLYSHKSRTLSIGFGIFWAIFILLFLLGVNNNFHHSAAQRFATIGERVLIFIRGRNAGKSIPIPSEIATNFSKQFSAVGHSTPLFYCSTRSTVKYKTDAIPMADLYGVAYDVPILRKIPIKEGRYFNLCDETEARNLCIIDFTIKKMLFGSTCPIGKYIDLGNSHVQVIGALNESAATHKAIFLSHTFFKKLFPMQCHNVSAVYLSLSSTAHAATVEAQSRAYFAHHLNVTSDSVQLLNIAQEANKLHHFFKIISIFIWIVGGCFLISGMIAMSNMMMVTMQERIPEIAIRKILGQSNQRDRGYGYV